MLEQYISIYKPLLARTELLVDSPDKNSPSLLSDGRPSSFLHRHETQVKHTIENAALYRDQQAFTGATCRSRQIDRKWLLGYGNNEVDTGFKGNSNPLYA